MQLRQYVEADYESRRDSIALRAQAEAQEINVQSSDVIDDMDGIHIEKDGPFRLPYAIITQGNGKRKGKRNRTRAAQTEADIFVLGTDVLKKRAKPKPRAKKKKENK